MRPPEKGVTKIYPLSILVIDAKSLMQILINKKCSFLPEVRRRYICHFLLQGTFD